MGSHSLMTTQSKRMTISRTVVLAVVLILASCGESDLATTDAPAPEEPATTQPATTDAPAPEEPATTQPATTDAPAPEEPATTQPASRCTLVVENDSVGGINGWSIDESGAVVSGTSFAEALATLSAECGEPDADSGWIYGCLAGVSWPEGPTADEAPLREMRWGALTVYFDRPYELQDGDEGRTAVYTGEGAVFSWNYGHREADDTSVVITDADGQAINIGTPMSQIADRAVNQLPEMDDEVSYGLNAFGLITLTGDDGVSYTGEVAPIAEPVASVQEAVDYSTLAIVGSVPICAG